MLLSDFFAEHPHAALAFSGGVDSAYLLWAAMRTGADVTAYYVKTAFQPEFELEDAKRLAGQLGARMKILRADILRAPCVAGNPADRCYHCKRALFGMLLETAAADGYHIVLDGTNASDDADDRPGMRALRELEVLSPLRLCDLTKPEIRRLSREAGLFTWDKPAYACLATRFPTGVALTAEGLTCVETAESSLFALGFTDFRVRVSADGCRIQVPAEQMAAVLDKREEIRSRLGGLFTNVTLDLKAR